MTIVILIILPITAIIVKKIVGKSQKYFKKTTRIFRTRKWSSRRSL